MPNLNILIHENGQGLGGKPKVGVSWLSPGSMLGGSKHALMPFAGDLS